ncbi:MAG: hypothetical protein IT375_16080 [Polyangiaceae bacterium]|nr:hypothetical protein [Polyangiaceae bacterium]
MERASFRKILLAVALVPLMLLPIWVSTCAPTLGSGGGSRPGSDVLTAGQ